MVTLEDPAALEDAQKLAELDVRPGRPELDAGGWG